MATGSNMRMENLFITLKEVQNEKICLEQKLHELKLRRHALEQDMDQINSRHCHIQERHRRMSETFAIAQQKVDQTLTNSLSFQADIERNRPKIDELQESIKSEKNLQLQHVKEFEEALLAVSSQLFQARDFYKKTALLFEIEKARKALGDLQKQAENNSHDVVTLCRLLEKLMQEERISSLSNFGFESSLLACIKAMLRDKVESEAYLNQIQGELKEIHDILQSTQ